MFKALCYCLNRDFGFGKKRLEFLINSIRDLLDESLTDECFWEHLDRVVIDELGIENELFTELDKLTDDINPDFTMPDISVEIDSASDYEAEKFKE